MNYYWTLFSHAHPSIQHGNKIKCNLLSIVFHTAISFEVFNEANVIESEWMETEVAWTRKVIKIKVIQTKPLESWTVFHYLLLLSLPSPFQRPKLFAQLSIIAASSSNGIQAQSRRKTNGKKKLFSQIFQDTVQMLERK